jgi:uncharacterized protein YllA (UPF0747 family)
MSTRTLLVRARVPVANQPPRDRLFDPLTDQLVRGAGLGLERFATRWSDTDALRSLAERKRRPLAPNLARELTELHRRLGASPASLANLERLARGEAVAAVAGQQPAPLGGPLYSLHKTADTLGLAAEAARRTGVPCVPLFWMHGEDSDFAEIRGATLADAALSLRDLSLPDDAHVEGGLVGNLALDPLRALEAEAARVWEGLPHAGDAADLLSGALSSARDFGEAHAALMLRLFAASGLVIVDPRLPAFREAARVVIDRYLARADAIGAQVRRAGDELERRGARRALSDTALDSFVFAIEDGSRRKVGVTEAAGRVLSPSVALRPEVQDAVLPTVAMACGPGELAYLAQLREAFEALEVLPACPVPRFSASWLPPAAVALLEASDADAFALVADADAVMRAYAEKQVPAGPRAALESAHRASLEGLEQFAAAARTVDPSLPQMVESARGKIDYQFQRLLEGLAGKVRHKLERQHPEWLRLRYYLLPGDKLQERRLCSMEVVAYRGRAVADELAELSAEHARRLADGVLEHLVLEL